MADDDPDDKVYDYDGIQMDTADHVWIDHNTLRHMNDGLIDSRKDTTYLTVSWNILGNHNKAFGIGWTDNVTARMTIHHNWIHDTNQRNPSTDNVAYAHLYNNYLENITSLRQLLPRRDQDGAGEQLLRQRQRPVLLRHRHAGRNRQRLPQTTGMRERRGQRYRSSIRGTLYQYTLRFGGRRRGAGRDASRARAPSSGTSASPQRF